MQNDKSGPAPPQPDQSGPGPRKVLVVHFKYLGDLVLATPALRSLKVRYPDCELHVATSEVAAPLVRNLPWIHRVWALPRERGWAGWWRLLPHLRALRAERFDVCVDLIGNDRGTFVSLLSGARERVGRVLANGFYFRRRLYTRPIEEFDLTRHESLAHWYIISHLGVPPPLSFAAEMAPDPACDERARAWLGGTEVLCFINASLPKKEWPLRHWRALFDMARAEGMSIGFTGGNRPRELALFDELRRMAPDVPHLLPGESLEVLVAAIARARGFISNDTGALHMAAALKVPTVGVFGPTAASKWAPLGPGNHALQGDLCTCSGHLTACERAYPCIDAVTPAQVMAAMRQMMVTGRETVLA